VNRPIDDAIQIYKQNQGDFSESLKWHFAYGIIVHLPDCFLLGFFCMRDSPWNSIDPCKADCFHATMCCGDMRKAAMQIHNQVKFLAYERETRGDHRIRFVNFQRFYNKLK
jgi:hypothetical protein